MASDVAVRSASDHFRENVSKIRSADELLSDYRMLNVTLRAFGLEGDMGGKAFLRQVLNSDLSDEKSIANRLSDQSYRRLAEAFGFQSAAAAQSKPLSAAPNFAERIISQYVEREYQRRVGEGDQNLRLALNARRELATLAQRNVSDVTKWYEIMGNIPLRKVFDGAFGFGDSYAKLPIDRQLAEYQEAADRMFGTASPSLFKDGEQVETLIRRFIVRSTAAAGATSNRFYTALTLLSNAVAPLAR
ncbi:DUF1217 domain-containing protein [Paracoccus sediminicola]|uniref:DUF1217 domain-containing protein n=1 Tax=Paracoccus sediminicola TaxID=3017783 RepID=UPI0022F01A2B|nr:DUF1217 domain-containing protein [Paracoccus sediminicola]WBU56886.1 DUF1217 domain-containing protein [Paracoccus sediminicola]